MVVFVLFGCQDWESPTFLGVYSTLELAEDATPEDDSFKFFEIQEYDLDS